MGVVAQIEVPEDELVLEYKVCSRDSSAVTFHCGCVCVCVCE